MVLLPLTAPTGNRKSAVSLITARGQPDALFGGPHHRKKAGSPCRRKRARRITMAETMMFDDHTTDVHFVPAPHWSNALGGHRN
jgi:hypothetical protein